MNPKMNHMWTGYSDCQEYQLWACSTPSIWRRVAELQLQTYLWNVIRPLTLPRKPISSTWGLMSALLADWKKPSKTTCTEEICLIFTVLLLLLRKIELPVKSWGNPLQAFCRAGECRKLDVHIIYEFILLLLCLCHFPGSPLLTVLLQPIQTAFSSPLREAASSSLYSSEQWRCWIAFTEH